MQRKEEATMHRCEITTEIMLTCVEYTHAHTRYMRMRMPVHQCA